MQEFYFRFVLNGNTLTDLAMVLLLCVATMFIAIVFGENVRFSGTGDTVIVPEYGLAMKRSGYTIG